MIIALVFLDFVPVRSHTSFDVTFVFSSKKIIKRNFLIFSAYFIVEKSLFERLIKRISWNLANSTLFYLKNNLISMINVNIALFLI